MAGGVPVDANALRRTVEWHSPDESRLQASGRVGPRRGPRERAGAHPVGVAPRPGEPVAGVAGDLGGRVRANRGMTPTRWAPHAGWLAKKGRRAAEVWMLLIGVQALLGIVTVLKNKPADIATAHVMTGALWTGIDLFMGFVIGPILRGVSLETRRTIIAGLIPRTLILMPTLSIVTSTAGWFLAVRMDYLDLGYPEFWWVIAALAIVTVLTVQGLGYLLPANLRLYFEIQKPQPDGEKIGRWMKTR